MIPRCVPAALAALLLAACAGLSPVERAPAATFDIIGRVLVSGDSRAFSSNLRWQHDAGRDELWLLTPLGQILAHISSEAAGATLITADRQEFRDRSAAALTQRALGWTLPLAELRHWIMGVPAPLLPAQAVQRDATGRLDRLEQSGWALSMDYDAAQSLPRRLELRRDGQLIRLVVDQRREAPGDTPGAARP